MDSLRPIPLKPLSALPLKEWFCWSLAAILGFMGAAMVSDPAAVGVVKPLLLAVAVRTFHAKHTRCPQSLNELATGFVDRFRPAKLTFGDTRFRNFPSGHGALLYHTALPPFGCRVCDFADNTWSFHD